MLGIELSIEAEALLSEASELLVGVMTDLLLFSYKTLLVRDLLSQVKVDLVVNT